MTGLCLKCDRLTATRSTRKIEGCRIGFVREYADDYARLICVPCLRASLPSNVAA